MDLPRVRLDGGAKKFRQRWGYELVNQPPVLLEEDEDEDEENTTADSTSLQETTTRPAALCAPSPLGEFFHLLFRFIFYAFAIIVVSRLEKNI